MTELRRKITTTIKLNNVNPTSSSTLETDKVEVIDVPAKETAVEILSTDALLSFMFQPEPKELVRQLCLIERLDQCYDIQTGIYDRTIDRLVVACSKAYDVETILKNIALINNRVFITNVITTRSLKQGVFKLMNPLPALENSLSCSIVDKNSKVTTKSKTKGKTKGLEKTRSKPKVQVTRVSKDYKIKEELVDVFSLIEPERRLYSTVVTTIIRETVTKKIKIT